jgi:hypothetical protein
MTSPPKNVPWQCKSADAGNPDLEGHMIISGQVSAGKSTLISTLMNLHSPNTLGYGEPIGFWFPRPYNPEGETP